MKILSVFAVSLLFANFAHAAVEPNYVSGKPPATTKVFESQGAAERQADLDFIIGMRPHHAGALSMSDEYLKSPEASNKKLKNLAKGIIRNQTFEIGMLDRVEDFVEKPIAKADQKEWRQVAEKGLAQKQRFVRSPMPHPFGIGATPVTKRDVEFAKAMVIHHEGALTMCNDYLSNPSVNNTYVQQLCLDILVDQKQEIAFMNKIITFYDGNPDDVKIDPSMIHGMEGMDHTAHGGHAGHDAKEKTCNCPDMKGTAHKAHGHEGH